MKKILAVLLALSMLFVLGACKEKPDSEYIKEKGNFVIGYTLFAPMNFEDDNGNLTGFETDFATAVCEKLGVKAEFQKIDWETKEVELKSKKIDCIWNGMTITPEREAEMSISIPYMANKQVLVIRADALANFTNVDGLDIVAEKESAGEEVATTDEYFKNANYTPVATQADALMNVSTNRAFGCVVDYVCSIGMIGEGTDYENLVVVDSLSFADEQYGIALRKGSDYTDDVNKAIEELAADGTLLEIAKKYKLENQIIVGK